METKKVHRTPKQNKNLHKVVTEMINKISELQHETRQIDMVVDIGEKSSHEVMRCTLGVVIPKLKEYREGTLKNLKKLDQALEQLRDTCEHTETECYGRDSHNDYYRCIHCLREF